jgi:MFS superfamily sulfate permease-like transporter
MLTGLKRDFPASIVVFFVALPLCLGIALASGAPPLAGIISGVIGGILVGLISGSKIGVSGPAAGLAAIVVVAIGDLGSFQAFLVAVVLAGFLQILFGLLRLGIIGYFFPNSVILGMLTGIGVIIVLKQIPHLLGLQAQSFFSGFKDLFAGPALIGLMGLLIIVVWDKLLSKKHIFFRLIQGSIVAVILGTVFKWLLDGTSFSVDPKFLVQIPIADSLEEFLGFFVFPDFSIIGHPKVWTVAFTIALVASLETLLSVEATDKLDPDKNNTPPNRELFAQGIGNILSGMIGGLPITQVIVRSSANVQSGGKSKISTVLHGFYLLLSFVLIGGLLNQIPNAALAAVLIVVGYKLAEPSVFVKMWKRGWTQFLPFIATVLVIVLKDVLWGIFVGLALGIVVILVKSFQNSLFMRKKALEDQDGFCIALAEEVTFLNKGAIQKALSEIPGDCILELDLRKTKYLDFDVIEILEDFVIQARNRRIEVRVTSEKGVFKNPESYLKLIEKLQGKGPLMVD